MAGSVVISRGVSFDIRTIDFLRVVDIFRSSAANSSTAAKLVETIDQFGVNMICADELCAAEFRKFAQLMREVRVAVGDQDKGMADFLELVCSRIDEDERIVQ